MDKLAVFVEGQTEQLFVEQFVVEVAGRRDIAIEMRIASGGSRQSVRRFRQLSASDSGGKKFSVLIVDSAADNRVASDIRDQYQGLVNAGYSLVLGLRDVFPHSRYDLPVLQDAMNRVLPKGALPIQVVFSIMEIEAWFLAEHTHLEKLYPQISLEDASAAIGFDLRSADVEDIPHPSETLDCIYRLAGHNYEKSKSQVSDVVRVLDYARLYIELPEQVSALKLFCDHLDSFLAEYSNS